VTYTKQFYKRNSDTFECYLEEERCRQIVLSSTKCHHKSILDVGVGGLPHYNCIEGWSRYVVVEPNKELVENIPSYIEVINSTLESSKLRSEFDFIILSSVLHLVEDYNRFLNKVKKLCHEDTVVHINVPNAQSFHRILGYRMGVIKNIYEMSEKDVKYDHKTMFTMHGLLYVLNDNGFFVPYMDTYMLKPFSDEQMSTFMNANLANGLVRMGRDFNKFGCEIVAEAKRIG
jgi:hypothetical protein